MTDKEPSGWIVQVTVPPEPEVGAPDAPWRSPTMRERGAPSFKYYNVAIAAPDKAIEATTKYLAMGAEAVAGAMSVARKLSAGELTALSLTAGEVKPA